ncbi:SpoIIE family protein phosphatase [Streptomyces sp. NPDC017964]|uniref:SpoIIE family protein phosphatase n=1 Tax=Streptomyces sp. NPDC017964 TaxID=3365022 RepID=UPI00378A8AAD
MTTAARYQPAGEGTAVGGDWDDVIPLSAEQVALVIGDEMGNGLSEAVTMGRLRTAGRTLLDLEQPLDELFFHLNEIVSGLGDGFYATCLCIVYDPVSRMRQANTVGHPPPVMLPPGGISYVLGLPVNPHLAPPLPLRYSRVQRAAQHDRGAVPEGLATRRELRGMGLNPGGNEGPVAILRCKLCATRRDC